MPIDHAGWNSSIATSSFNVENEWACLLNLVLLSDSADGKESIYQKYFRETHVNNKYFGPVRTNREHLSNFSLVESITNCSVFFLQWTQYSPLTSARFSIVFPLKSSLIFNLIFCTKIRKKSTILSTINPSNFYNHCYLHSTILLLLLRSHHELTHENNPLVLSIHKQSTWWTRRMNVLVYPHWLVVSVLVIDASQHLENPRATVPLLRDHQ